MEPIELNYTPKFTKEECMLGLVMETHKNTGGWGCLDEDVGKKTYTESISLFGSVIQSEVRDYPRFSWGVSSWGFIVCEVANKFLRNECNKIYHSKAFQFLSENGKQIASDIRYYELLEFETRLQDKEKEYQQELLNMKRTAQYERYQINMGRLLTKEESEQVWKDICKV